MLKMKKKATTTLFVLATSCFAAGFAMLGFQATDVAKADGAMEDIYMKASASVRVDDPIGIRFSTYVSEEYASSGKSFGTFIIPETQLSKSEEISSSEQTSDSDSNRSS